MTKDDVYYPDLDLCVVVEWSGVLGRCSDVLSIQGFWCLYSSLPVKLPFRRSPSRFLSLHQTRLRQSNGVGHFLISYTLTRRVALLAQARTQHDLHGQRTYICSPSCIGSSNISLTLGMCIFACSPNGGNATSLTPELNVPCLGSCSPLDSPRTPDPASWKHRLCWRQCCNVLTGLG
jgi:hypothetical protein